MASAYLSKTSGTTTNNKIGTFSAWIKFAKKTETSSYEPHIFDSYASSDNRSGLKFEAQKLLFYSRVGASTQVNVSTNRLFRDVSAWYHVVVAIDMTQATSTNRLKMYVNGVQETSMSATTYGSQNDTIHHFLGSVNLAVGRYGGNTSVNHMFDGQLAHVHYIDGTAYAASDFGQTDTTTGIWTPKTSPSVTYGNNGYFLKMDNAANMGLDSGGGSNNMTTSGTIIQTKGTPSNVYATWNSLIYNKSTFTNTNTTSASGSSGELNATSTLGMAGGKWYMEFKRVSGNYPIFGIIDDLGMSTHTSETSVGLGKTGTTKSIALRLNDGKTRVNNVVTTQGGAISNGDIVGVAVDKTTNKIYFSKNGQWSNGSGAWDSTTFNAAVGATDVSSILTGDIWFFACGTDTGEANNTFSANFGNGYFGTTAITSAGSNGNGSLFEYDVPSGFYALNTKNIGTQS